jgi:hypothetical protein
MARRDELIRRLGAVQRELRTDSDTRSSGEWRALRDEYEALNSELGPGWVSEEAEAAPVAAANADIHWEDDDRGRVKTLVVFDRLAGTYVDDRKLSASLGACTLGWMKGDPSNTPEGVFIRLVRDGFASPEALHEALLQFGKIDNCDWARTMASALRRRLQSEGLLARDDEGDEA